MRFFLSALLVLVGVASISASLHPFFMEYREGQRYFIAEDKQGKLQIVDRLATDPEARFTASTDVVFYLYTRKNPTSGYVLKNGDAASLSGSNFDKSKATKIITHGWNNNGNSDVNMNIRDAFLAVLDVNVICVDWGKGANGLYGTAVDNVPLVSTWEANLVDWLISQGAAVSSFHIMGHSLGGHIAGQTSRKVTRGKIPYLTAFDPAGPSWGPGTERVRPTDAAYTEIIHSDAGYLGIKEPVGHNDFYPNEGQGMPGCLPVNVGCSHGRSYEYFASSLDNTFFQANQCANVDEALNNKCSNLSKSYMGGSKVKAIKGIYHLKTSANKPYYLN